MATWTNRGKYRLLRALLFGEETPTNFYVALCNNPTADPDAGDLWMWAEINEGMGYVSGGQQISSGSNAFDYIYEDDTNDKVTIQIKDVVWTAAGGSIPYADDGATFAVLLDDNATPADREVYCWWSLGSPRTALNGQQIVLKDLTIELVN